MSQESVPDEDDPFVFFQNIVKKDMLKAVNYDLKSEAELMVSLREVSKIY